MTLEKIENHIVDEATAEAAGMAADAREQAAKIAADAREEADAELALAVERLKAELANAFDQSIGRLRTDQRLEMLKIKTAILNDVFAAATEKLLHNDAYWQLTRQHLRLAAGQTGEILCRVEQRDVIGGMIDELNAELDGKVPPLADENADILGGFVFRGDRIDLDFSLDSQIETFRARVLPDLMAEAFPED